MSLWLTGPLSRPYSSFFHQCRLLRLLWLLWLLWLLRLLRLLWLLWLLRLLRLLWLLWLLRLLRLLRQTGKETPALWRDPEPPSRPLPFPPGIPTPQSVDNLSSPGLS